MCQYCGGNGGPVDEIDLLRAFHGHLGPYVYAGLRMGKFALGALNANPHFGMEVDVWCPAATPRSCMLDGIQFSTGCTLGKQNIRHHACEDDIRAVFLNRDTSQKMALRLRSEGMAKAVAEMDANGDEAGAAVVQSLPHRELFEEIDPDG